MLPDVIISMPDKNANRWMSYVIFARFEPGGRMEVKGGCEGDVEIGDGRVLSRAWLSLPGSFSAVSGPLEELLKGLLFAQGSPCQTIQVRGRYRGKKSFSIQLVVQDIPNGNQRGRDQDPQHAESRHT